MRCLLGALLQLNELLPWLAGAATTKEQGKSGETHDQSYLSERAPRPSNDLFSREMMPGADHVLRAKMANDRTGILGDHSRCESV